MRCIVPSCWNKQYAKNPLISFHRFPSIPDLKNKWISTLKLEKDLVSTTGVVCSDHFQESDFIGDPKEGRRRLFPCAIPYLGPEHDFDDKSVDPLCINNFVETLLEGIEDVKEQQEEKEQTEDEKQEEKEKNVEEENLQIIQNIQIAPPTNQNIDLHTQNDYSLYLHPSPTLTLPSLIKTSAKEKLQDLDKTEGERNRNVNTLNILSQNTLKSSYNELLMLSPIKRAAKNESGNQKIVLSTNNNTPDDSALWVPCTCVHSLPGESNRNVNTQNILSQNTLKSSYNELLMLSPIKRATQNESGNQNIELSKNNTPNDPALCSVKCSRVHSLPGESNRDVNTQNILSQNTSYNELLILSPIKRAAQNESGNQKIELSTNNKTPNDPALCSVPFSCVHPLPAATKVMSESYDELLAQKSADQEKIRKLELKLVQKNKSIKLLNQKVRRGAKRIQNLKDTIKIIKNNSLLNEETSAILQKCLGEDDLVEVLWP